MKLIKPNFSSLWTWLILLALISIIAYLASKSQEKAKIHGTKTVKINAKIQSQSSIVLSVGGEVDVEGGLINVSATGSGIFKQILVEEGDKVEAGQILAVQENSKEKLDLHSQENNLKSAQIAYQRTQLELKINTRELTSIKKQRSLDAVSQATLNNSTDSLERTKLSMQEQEIRLSNARVAVETAKAALDLSNIRAPVAGYIMKVDAKLGLGTSRNNVSNAFVLLPLSERVIVLEIKENDRQKIHLGQKVEIAAKSATKTNYSGTVQKIALAFTYVDKNDFRYNPSESRTITVTIASQKLPLMIGQSVIVKFKRVKTASNDLPPADKH